MLHAMRTGDMKQEMGTGPGPFGVIADSSQQRPGLASLREEHSGPTLRPDHLLARGRSLAARPACPGCAADAGLAEVRLKDDATHLTPGGWHLSANPLRPFSPGRRAPLCQELARVRGLTATHGAEGLSRSHRKVGSSFPSGSVTARPNSCVSPSATGLDAIACKTENTY